MVLNIGFFIVGVMVGFLLNLYLVLFTRGIDD